MKENTITYHKILVARHSIENKCYADDGVALIVKPKKLRMNRGHTGHHFLSHLDKKTKSQYGWVKVVDPITLNEFVNKYVGSTDDSSWIAHNKIMLDSIQQLNVDTPVAATYSERGVEQKRMDFTIHRVIFQK